MTKELIKLKKEETDKKFKELEVAKTELNKKVAEIINEQLKLQGEYRLLETMEKSQEGEGGKQDSNA